MSLSIAVEVESPISAERLFKAALLDWHKLGPQLVPQIVASGAGVEGDGVVVGSVRQLNFTSVMPFSFVKERLDFIDHEKFECKTTVVEGGNLGTKLESASAHYKLEPTSSGGCVYKAVASYKTLSGLEDQADQTKVKEAVVGQFKAVEAYLVANPTAYA